MGFALAQAELVTGNIDGYRVAERRNAFNFYLFAGQAAHFHQFNRHFKVGKFLYYSFFAYFKL